MSFNLKEFLRAKSCDEWFFNDAYFMDINDIKQLIYPKNNQYFVKEIIKNGL